MDRFRSKRGAKAWEGGGARLRILGSSEVFNLLDTVFTNKIYEISLNDLMGFFHLGDATRVPPLLVYLLRRVRIQ